MIILVADFPSSFVPFVVIFDDMRILTMVFPAVFLSRCVVVLPMFGAISVCHGSSDELHVPPLPALDTNVDCMSRS